MKNCMAVWIVYLILGGGDGGVVGFASVNMKSETKQIVLKIEKKAVRKRCYKEFMSGQIFRLEYSKYFLNRNIIIIVIILINHWGCCRRIFHLIESQETLSTNSTHTHTHTERWNVHSFSVVNGKKSCIRERRTLLNMSNNKKACEY